MFRGCGELLCGFAGGRAVFVGYGSADLRFTTSEITDSCSFILLGLNKRSLNHQFVGSLLASNLAWMFTSGFSLVSLLIVPISMV